MTKDGFDFLSVVVEENTSRTAKNNYTIYPDFFYAYNEDIVVKGNEVYAFWDGDRWIQSSDAFIMAIDKKLHDKKIEIETSNPGKTCDVRYLNNSRSGSMKAFKDYLRMKSSDDHIQFNKEIKFHSDEVKQKDYSTYKLQFDPIEGDTQAFDNLFGVLYDEEELHKILWALGALLCQEMDKIHKFLFIYGSKGTGKGTMLDLIQDMFKEYIGDIDLRQLTGRSEFATQGITEVPILMDTDSDLSHASNEQNILKLTSHEPILIRKLYKDPYSISFPGLLITASNEHLKFNNADSGSTRRALVTRPSGRKVDPSAYRQLVGQMKYEHAAIAYKAMETYRKAGPYYYEDYIDIDMVKWNDPIFDFFYTKHGELDPDKGITYASIKAKFSSYLENTSGDMKIFGPRLYGEVAKYYHEHEKEHTNPDGTIIHSWYRGLKYDYLMLNPEERVVPEIEDGTIKLYKEEESVFDLECASYPAQYAGANGHPSKKWSNVDTTLNDIDPSRLHFVQVPSNHIVLDFDLKNEDGEKDMNLNIVKASVYPPTYTEVSKSGGGLHLHYWYDGNPEELAHEVEPGVEIKVYTGNASLRRKYTESNGKSIAHISTGLPLKDKDGELGMFKDIEEIVWTERKLRNFIEKCLNKEHHGATKPEVDFIHKVLNDAVQAGAKYDLRDMREKVHKFAMSSSNQQQECLRVYNQMVFSTIEEQEDLHISDSIVPDDELYFYDWEVYKNVNILVWKKYTKNEIYDALGGLYGKAELKPLAQQFSKEWMDSVPESAWDGESYTDPDKKFGIWYNPEPTQIEWFLSKPIVAYNNLNYDDHIMYDVFTGKKPIEVYNQSKMLVGGPRAKNPGKRGPAYGQSYLDVFEMLDIRQSLKDWEIQLGYPHDEFEFPWDEPLAKENWGRSARYCANDVGALEFLFRTAWGQNPYTARKILCEITGLSTNTKTQQLGEAFIFGADERPQDKFNWYDLSTEFPGYTFDKFRTPKSQYLGEDPSEGGYVFSKPGVYENVVVLDIASLHPHSLIAENYFGPYTPKFEAMVKLRMHIKHKEWDEALHVFDSIDPAFAEKLKPYLEDRERIGSLAHALKIVINMIYGMTSAPYDNKFRDPRNIDNIVAKRGALFMLQLKHEVLEKGYEVAHIKTDSIKIPNGDQAIIDYCMARAKEYGYTFEHEHTYSKMALVNKAVLIAEIAWPEKEKGKWEAVGTQFAVPYVKKRLFEPDIDKATLTEDDLMVFKKSKAGPIYLGDQFVGRHANIYASRTGYKATVRRDFDLTKPLLARFEKLKKREYLLKTEWAQVDEDDSKMLPLFVARASKELGFDEQTIRDCLSAGLTKEYIVPKASDLTGTKGHKWALEQDFYSWDEVDWTYYDGLVYDAVDAIYEVGDGDIIFNEIHPEVARKYRKRQKYREMGLWPERYEQEEPEEHSYVEA